MRPLYIFDLDGTLADCRHRLSYIRGEKKDWRTFFERCWLDTPIKPLITTMTLLAASADVRIWTGRSEEAMGATVRWLTEHLPVEIPLACIQMRRSGDHRPDDELKKEWLDRLPQEDRRRLVAVFEDRTRVVQMWRNAGITCFQVAPGDF